MRCFCNGPHVAEARNTSAPEELLTARQRQRQANAANLERTGQTHLVSKRTDSETAVGSSPIVPWDSRGLWDSTVHPTPDGVSPDSCQQPIRSAAGYRLFIETSWVSRFRSVSDTSSGVANLATTVFHRGNRISPVSNKLRHPPRESWIPRVVQPSTPSEPKVGW